MENFANAFDNARLSDKLLQILVSPPAASLEDCADDESNLAEQPAASTTKKRKADVAGLDEEEEISGGGPSAKRVRRDSDSDSASGGGGGGDADAKVYYRQVPVSSAILAQRSAFFATMFASEWKETNERQVELTVRDQDEGALLMLLLETTFTGRLPDSSKCKGLDLFRLLLLADKYGVAFVIKGCQQALRDVMTHDFGLQIIEAVDKANLHLTDATEPIVTAASQGLIQRFKDLPAPSTATLPVWALKMLLASDDLVVQSENAVLQCVLHDLPAAQRAELLPYVRWPMLSKQCLLSAIKDLAPGDAPADKARALDMERFWRQSAEDREIEAKTGERKLNVLFRKRKGYRKEPEASLVWTADMKQLTEGAAVETLLFVGGLRFRVTTKVKNRQSRSEARVVAVLRSELDDIPVEVVFKIHRRGVWTFATPAPACQGCDCFSHVFAYDLDGFLAQPLQPLQLGVNLRLKDSVWWR